MIVRLIFVAGFAFLFGNIIWDKIPSGSDPKFFYIPWSIMVLLLFYALKDKYKQAKNSIPIFIEYFILLAYGNVVKQVFYVPEMRVLNDYVWGVFVTLWLLGNLTGFNKWLLKTRFVKWVTRILRPGKSS